MRAPTLNPVLRRELLERWRGKRTFLVLTAYVALLGGLMQTLWWLGSSGVNQHVRFGGIPDFTVTPALGRFMFDNLVGVVLLLVLFIAPGYAAAQIASERERRTLSLLQVTLVRPWSIALGKLGASIAWVVLLVVAALPFGAATFFLGGVTVGDLVRSAGMVLALTVCVAAISLGISSAVRRTSAAIVVTYGLILVLVLGTGFAHLVETRMRELNFTNDTPIALQFNPFYGVADAANASSNIWLGGDLPTLLSPFASQLPASNRGWRGGPRLFEEVAVAQEFAGPGGFVDDVFLVPDGQFGGFGEEGLHGDMWWRVLAIYAGMGLLGFLVAARRLRPDRVPPRYRRKVTTPDGSVIEPLADVTTSDTPPAEEATP